LRLTDLARAEMDIHEIAAYAGHRSVQTTLLYIHLSGRELAPPTSNAIQLHSHGLYRKPRPSLQSCLDRPLVSARLKKILQIMPLAPPPGVWSIQKEIAVFASIKKPRLRCAARSWLCANRCNPVAILDWPTLSDR
jgi:hypothetical protein